MRSTFWKIAITNWILACAVAALGAYFALAHPTSTLVFAALFLVGIAAFVVAVLAFIVAWFGP